MSSYPPRSLLEQQCMTFCAVMKAMEGHLTEHNILPTCDKVWQWTKATLAAELNAMNSLEPPPDSPAEPEPEPDDSERRYILVTNVEILRKGVGKNNKPYTLWRVTDDGGIPYTTFAGSRFQIGKTYSIVFKTSQWGATNQREILESTLIEEPEEER